MTMNLLAKTCVPALLVSAPRLLLPLTAAGQPRPLAVFTLSVNVTRADTGSSVLQSLA
jgi:hypothetical protein